MSKPILWALVPSVCCVVLACGGSGGSGGTSGSGGATNSGGTTSSGGITSSGGTTSSGGAAHTGGSNAGGSGAGGSGGSGGTSTSCDAGSTCLPTAPDEWTGPVHVTDYAADAPEPACPSEFGNDEGVYSSGLDAGTFNCQCTCSNPGYHTCQYPVYYSASSCPATTGTLIAAPTPNECVSIDAGSGYYTVGPAITSVGSCTPSANHQIDEPTFTEASKVCSGSFEGLGCDAGQLCLPETTTGAQCIYRSGDHECPEGPYSTRKVLHQGFDDTRACSACSCGSATSTCTGTLTFRSGPNCTTTGSTLQEVETGSCSGNITAPGNLVAKSDTWTASCPAQGGMQSGSVTLTGTTTFCCAP